AVKPFLLLFVPYWVIRRQWQALVAAMGSGGLLVLAGVVVFGAGEYVAWLRQLPEVSWAGHYLNASWHGLVRRAFGVSDYAPVANLPGVMAPLGIAGAIAI